jgi:hypothetical protein
MASLDDRVEEAQNRIVHFFVNNEQYINEYITIPLFYESIFHNTGYNTIRCFILSLLILRQIFQKVNNKHMTFDKIYLIAPIFAYIALRNRYTSTLFYSLVYSINTYEGIFLGVSTEYLYSYRSFEAAYIFHVLYILFRNNVKILIEPIPNTQLTNLNTKIIHYIPPTFTERIYSLQETVNNFINTEAEQIRNSLMY